MLISLIDFAIINGTKVFLCNHVHFLQKISNCFFPTNHKAFAKAPLSTTLSHASPIGITIWFLSLEKNKFTWNQDSGLPLTPFCDSSRIHSVLFFKMKFAWTAFLLHRKFFCKVVQRQRWFQP